MIRRRTITSYVWNSVSGNKMVILSNCIRNFFRKFELLGNSVQGENPAPDNPQEIKSAGRFDEASGKYLLDVKVTGKNLLDMADIQNENGKIDSDFSKAKSIKPFKVIKDRKYLLISKGAMIVDVRYSSIYFGEDDLAYGQDSSRKLTTGTGYSCFIGTETRKILVAKETCTITKTMMHGTRTEKDAYEVEELGLFEIINDNPNIDYQPYTEQSMQIVLNEPLRGVGEYKDMLTKDGVVRKIYPPYEINLNDLRDGGYSRTNTVMFSVKVQNKTVGYASLKPSILCNILPDCGLQTGNIYNDDKECIAVGGGIVLFRVNKSRLKDISSFEAIKQSFIELMEGKKMLVEYALETSVTEPLPGSVQAQLQALHSENGVTHVFVDSGEVECGINIEYKYKS